jgi:hypothetical protein
LTQQITSQDSIVKGLDFILSHFNEGFPRKISTLATENGQFKVDTREEALYFFERTPLDRGMGRNKHTETRSIAYRQGSK